MSKDDLPTFETGDLIEVRGYKYEVTQVDPAVGGGILQYRLSRFDEDAPGANLQPLQEGTWGVSLHFEESPEAIEKISEGESDG